MTAFQELDANDLPILEDIALHGCLPWAGDIAAGIAGEAGATLASPITMAGMEESGHVQSARHDADEGSTLQRLDTIGECPLHTAMRHLAEAAVAQHVLYLEGEVRARSGLLTTISRWEHMHTVIRECVCPATREVKVGAPALAEIVNSALDEMFMPGQQPLRNQFARALRVCSGCTSSAECPLGACFDSESARG